MTPRLIGVVLAGGASTRMGREKALLDGGAGPLAACAADALAAAGADRVVLVGATADVGAALGLEVVADRWPGEGPLGGIATALAYAASAAPLRTEEGPAPIVVVVACDQPDLDGPTLAALVDRVASGEPSVDIAAAVAGDHVLPFPSAWRTSPAVAEAVVGLVEAGERRARAALQVAPLATIAVRSATVADLDTPAALADHRRALRSPP